MGRERYRPSTGGSRASSRSRFSLESSPSARFAHPDEREHTAYVTSYHKDYILNKQNASYSSENAKNPVVAGHKNEMGTKDMPILEPENHWDDKTESWQPGKPRSFQFFKEHFESQIEMKTPDIPEPSEAFIRSSTDYGRALDPGTSVLGQWEKGRPQGYIPSVVPMSYAAPGSASHASRKREKKTIEEMKWSEQYERGTNGQRATPAPSSIPGPIDRDITASPSKWSGVRMDRLMLVPGNANNRTRWNRNASVVGEAMMMPEEEGAAPLTPYDTEYGEKARQVLDSAGPETERNGYGDKTKKRDDTMVSADCPTWMQLPHVGVKQLTRDQISSLEQWNVPLPKYYLPTESGRGSEASFASRPGSVASGYSGYSRASRGDPRLAHSGRGDPRLAAAHAHAGYGQLPPSHRRPASRGGSTASQQHQQVINVSRDATGRRVGTPVPQKASGRPLGSEKGSRNAWGGSQAGSVRASQRASGRGGIDAAAAAAGLYGSASMPNLGMSRPGSRAGSLPR